LLCIKKPEEWHFTLFLLLLFIASALAANAQINTELMRKAFAGDGFQNTIGFSITSSSGNSEFTDYSAGWRSDYYSDDFNTFVAGLIKYNEGSGKINAHRGFAHFRFVSTLDSLFHPEVFLQTNYDRSLRIDSRFLAGGGVRCMLFNINPDADSLGKFSLALGIGGFWEYEKINGIPEFYSTKMLRTSTYLNLNWKLNKTINLIATGYIQNSLTKSQDFRILFNTISRFKITRFLSLGIDVNYRFDNEPSVDGLKKYTLEIINSMTVDF
jgi:hypothetical protein